MKTTLKNGEGQQRATKQYSEGQLRATEQRNKLKINMLVAWCLTEKPAPLMGLVTEWQLQMICMM